MNKQSVPYITLVRLQRQSSTYYRPVRYACGPSGRVTACVVYTADSIRRLDSKTNRTADSIRDAIQTKKNDSQVPDYFILHLMGLGLHPFFLQLCFVHHIYLPQPHKLLSCELGIQIQLRNCECYYPSTRTENKGLLALFSVHQGRCVDMLLDRLGLA